MSSEPIRVLLVEDNLGDARLLYEDLEEALPGQFQMAHVRQLSEALEYLWKEPCHVVLLDLGLPDSHGIDTLVLTRCSCPMWQSSCSRVSRMKHGGAGTEGGAQDYLVKGQVDSKLLALHALCHRAQGGGRGVDRARGRSRQSGGAATLATAADSSA